MTFFMCAITIYPRKPPQLLPFATPWLRHPDADPPIASSTGSTQVLQTRVTRPNTPKSHITIYPLHFRGVKEKTT